MDKTREILINQVTQWDIKQQRKPNYNIHALAIYFDGIDHVMELIKEGKPIRKALITVFNGRLLDVLLRAVGEQKSTLDEQRI